jgi:hypothetical protein
MTLPLETQTPLRRLPVKVGLADTDIPWYTSPVILHMFWWCVWYV